MARIKWYEKFAPKPGNECLGLCFATLYYSGKVMIHTVQQNESYRIDLIAWKYLDDVSLWRTIADYNSLKDPIKEIVPQRVLFIPTSPIDYTTAYVPSSYSGVI
jgi:hypothetical protein